MLPHDIALVWALVFPVWHPSRYQVLGMKTGQSSAAAPAADAFDVKNRLHYLSIHFLDRAEFGRMRLLREVTESWMDQKLKIPGFDFCSTPPQVPQEEIAKVPGADVALGSFDALKLEVLTREGSLVNIKPDEIKFFRSINDAICEDFEELHKDHQDRCSRCHLASQDDGIHPLKVTSIRIHMG